MYLFFSIIDAIGSLALSSNNQNEFVTGEGDCSELLVKILFRYKDRTDVCISVCSAICNLTHLAPKNQVVINKVLFGFGGDKMSNLLIEIINDIKIQNTVNNSALYDNLCGISYC